MTGQPPHRRTIAVLWLPAGRARIGDREFVVLMVLGAFLTYKARRAGVPLVQVDPRYTSQTCNRCGHRDKRNRPDQETFICRSCGVVAHADHNAARNIAQRGVEGWGAVNRPHAAATLPPVGD